MRLPDKNCTRTKSA